MVFLNFFVKIFQNQYFFFAKNIHFWIFYWKISKKKIKSVFFGKNRDLIKLKCNLSVHLLLFQRRLKTKDFKKYKGKKMNLIYLILNLNFQMMDLYQIHLCTNQVMMMIKTSRAHKILQIWNIKKRRKINQENWIKNIRKKNKIKVQLYKIWLNNFLK